MEFETLMQLYTRADIDDVPWPDTADGAYARRVLGALVREGARPYIANVGAELGVLCDGKVVLPLAVAERRGAPRALDEAYVCSPTVHYVDYAQREVELELHDRPLLRRAIPPLLDALRPLLRWSEIERCVYVNNWLLSTNLYPPLAISTLRHIRNLLTRRYPDHTIIFRSINAELNGTLLRRLRGLGFEKVFSRQVYLLDPAGGAHLRRRDLKNDQRLARRSGYSWLEHDELDPGRDGGRLAELYADLYLRKYSPHNPHFTPRLIERALRERWLTLWALARDGRIDGVAGYVERHGVMTAPLLGYDRTVSQEEGLYRLLSLKLTEVAARRGLLLNMSSGAAAFKRQRGGRPSMEYSMVYHAHLPARRRLPWRLLASLSRAAIIPLMERLEL